MNQEMDKQRLNFSTTIEISEDNYWVVVTIEDKGRDCTFDQMPERIRDRCHKDKGSVHIVRILAKNIVSAKIYNDFILVGLLKWQATQNKEGKPWPLRFY